MTEKAATNDPKTDADDESWVDDAVEQILRSGKEESDRKAEQGEQG